MRTACGLFCFGIRHPGVQQVRHGVNISGANKPGPAGSIEDLKQKGNAPCNRLRKFSATLRGATT